MSGSVMTITIAECNEDKCNEYLYCVSALVYAEVNLEGV